LESFDDAVHHIDEDDFIAGLVQEFGNEASDLDGVNFMFVCFYSWGVLERRALPSDVSTTKVNGFLSRHVEKGSYEKRNEDSIQ
jgi:hypothetical protein